MIPPADQYTAGPGLPELPPVGDFLRAIFAELRPAMHTELWADGVTLASPGSSGEFPTGDEKAVTNS